MKQAAGSVRNFSLEANALPLPKLTRAKMSHINTVLSKFELQTTCRDFNLQSLHKR